MLISRYVLLTCAILSVLRATPSLAVDCTQAQVITCAGTAGFAIPDLLCLTSAPSTCTQAVCNVTRWQALGACLGNVPCFASVGSSATCQSTYQVCPPATITELCAIVAVPSTGGGPGPASTPAPNVYSGTLRLAGDWSGIVDHPTKLIAVSAALAADLSEAFALAVTIKGVALGSLIVTWETAATVADVTAFQSRVNTAKGSSSWLVNTQSAYQSNGGSGSVVAESLSATEGGASGAPPRTMILAALTVFLTLAAAIL